MRITGAGLIIALVIGIGFALSVPHTSEIKEAAPQTEEVTRTVPVVAIQDAYKTGVHTITGSLTVPNPCTLISADAQVLGNASTTQTISVRITAPEDTGICLQIPHDEKFSATIKAPAGLPINVFVNGTLASTTDQ